MVCIPVWPVAKPPPLSKEGLMKSLVRALRTTTSSLLPLFLLTSTAAMAMETTKKSVENKTMAIIGEKKLSIEAEKFSEMLKLFKPKTLGELADEYYENNSTLLVGDKSLINTIIKVQNIPIDKKEEIAANFEELMRATKNGAKKLHLLANSDEKKISEFAKIAKHPDVVDMIKYLCLCSCNIRPDATCFKEGIVYLKPGTKYCETLRTFLTAYRTRVEKESITQKSSIHSLIERATTTDAFRLMCITLTKTNQELLIPFLGKFKDFHITVPKNPNVGIRIKPERLPKTSLLNIAVTKVHATPDAGPEYNKETDISQDLIDTFTATFPNANIEKNPVDNKPLFGAMYSHILKNLSKTADVCLSVFEEFVVLNRLNHLTDRIGSEIILGEEELLESNFADIENQILLSLLDDVLLGSVFDDRMKEHVKVEKQLPDSKNKDLCGLFIKFKALRKSVRDYAISKKPTAEMEKALRSDIDDFFILVNEKTLDSISDQDLRSYLFNTGATLKYLASLKEEVLPNAPTTTLREQLVHPIFEIWYQKQLDLKNFVEKAKEETLKIKSKELATATDNALSELARTILEKYEKDLTSKYDVLKLGVLQKNTLKKQVKDEDIFRLSSQIYNKLHYPINRLVAFQKTKQCLHNILESLVGTAIEKSKKDIEFKNKFTTLLSLMKTDIVNTITLMGKEAEKNGYVCSVGNKGKKIISEFQHPGMKKMPGTIRQLKTNLHIFNSEETLKEHIENLYKSVKK